MVGLVTKPIDRIIQRYEAANAKKKESDHLRLEAGKYAWPSAQDQNPQTRSEGQLRTVELYDSTPAMAAYRMTSGIFSYQMPVGAKWFEFVAQAHELNQDAEIQNWLSIATALTHAEIWRSNFQREMFATIRSMVVFGTGVISVEQVDGEVIFKSHHIKNLCFEVNSKGEIDTVYRKMFYTARQAVQEFGNADLGKTINKALQSGNMDEKFEFIHACMPNKDYDSNSLGGSRKKYKSLYIAMPDRHVVKQGGFDELPYLVARFDVVPGEIMGRGPAIEGLPEMRMLNRMKRTFIEASEKAANPPLITEDDGVVGQPVTGPSGMIYVRPGAMKPEALQTGINMQLNAEILANQQDIIREIFFNDLFQALARHRNMTATEVVERVEEKIVHLAPAINALQKEIFSPLIGRVRQLLVRGLRIPPPPGEFDMDIVYQGRLALAMSNMQTNAIESTLAKWAPYAEGTNVFDNVDFDVSFRTSWLNSGAPAEGLKDYEVMIERRETRDQMEMAAAQAEVADTASKAYRNVGKAPEMGSLAEALG